MSEYLARAEHFRVTIRDSYDAVQPSGEKIEFGSLRKVTVSRPDRLRIEVERSDGEKNLVIFDGKDLTVYTANKNVYATVSRPGTLDDAIKYGVDDLKIRVPLAMMLLSTLPSELDNLVVSADYVDTTTITDVPTDHIAARTSRGVDCQVWVAQGSEPSPTDEVAEAIEGAEEAVDFRAKVQLEPGGFLPDIRSLVVAVVGSSREAAGDSAPRIKLSVRGQARRTKLSVSNPGKLRQIHASRALISARPPPSKAPIAARRVVRDTDRTRNRTAKTTKRIW